jgi:outer membrane lipoprotein-sorting protein
MFPADRSLNISLACLAIVFSLALTIVLAGYGPPALAAEPPATAPKSIQAAFIQEKEMKILARPLISQGRLLFRAPDNLRWEYLSPVKSALLMQNGVAHKFVSENGAWLEDKSPGLDAIPTVLAQMTGWLEGRFSDADDSALFAASRQGQVVRLVPKADGMRAVIAAIELRLIKNSDLVEEVDIYESAAADAVTRIKFRDTVINQAIPDALFATP